MDHLILEFGVALLLISFTALLANKFNFSIIPFLIIVGMLVGPHAPSFWVFDFTFIESSEFISFLGRIGIIFLLFYLGIEFSVGKLIKSGKSIMVGGSFYIGLNFSLGLLFGFVNGFAVTETLIIAGITTISSSAIVAKSLVDLKRTANQETHLILGMIMFDDIFLAVYLSVISGFILGDNATITGTLISITISICYMLAFFVVARKGVKILNKLFNIESNEIFILTIFAVLFFIAGFSETLHIAEAIGALLLGLAFSETIHAKRIEHMVIPFRDFFGAIFFFSFGLSIDPSTLSGAVGLAVSAVILTLIGNFVAGMYAGRKAGMSHKASTNIGLTITSRGEFSIVIANLGLAGGVAAIIQPFSALYVLILAILGPLLTKNSVHIYNLLNNIFKWKPRKTPEEQTNIEEK